LKIWPFSFSWNYGITHGHILRAPNRTSEWRIASESSLDLTLTQHFRDEEPEPREVRARLEAEPLRAWYYRIFPNSRTLVILLQVDPTSGDEPTTICVGCYKTKNISIFAWFLVPGIRHYHWLHGPIRRLPPNSKADYLVCTVWRILDFLQLWIITMA
jgi:hypothetical protein